MLSRKVCCAILILNELNCSGLYEKTGCRTLRRTALAERCSLDNNLTFRRVIQQLRQSNYISTVGSSVKLTCEPSDLSIFELFVALHRGIPLGEEVVDKHGDDYYSELRCQKIRLLEEEVAEVSRRYFERRTVASMMNLRKNYSKRT